MVYLICAGHWSGVGKVRSYMDWSGSKSAPSYADVRSHLSGSSEIQPLAAREEIGTNYLSLVSLFTSMTKELN